MNLQGLVVTGYMPQEQKAAYKHVRMDGMSKLPRRMDLCGSASHDGPGLRLRDDDRKAFGAGACSQAGLLLNCLYGACDGWLVTIE